MERVTQPHRVSAHTSAPVSPGGPVSLSTVDIAHILVALAALLLCTHSVGTLFVRMRQPRAIGEVVGRMGGVGCG